MQGLPYVPFRMFFVEGQIDVGGDNGIGADPSIVQMMPVFCSLGDYDNIFCVRKILGQRSLEPFSMESMHAEHKWRDNLREHWGEHANSDDKKLSNTLLVCGFTIAFTQGVVDGRHEYDVTSAKKRCLESYVSHFQELVKISEWGEWQKLYLQ